MRRGLPGELLDRAGAIAQPGERRMLGITGPPGAGKSTLGEAVVDALGSSRAVLVPMDGFHLAQRELERLGRAGRKGAPDTFDVAGFVALLRRLREPVPGQICTAPCFDRAAEEPVADAIQVPDDVPLVVVEGNYLLHDAGGWAPVVDLLDETWFLDVGEEVRLRRLIARHVRFGRSPLDALAWSLGPDQANTVLVAASRNRADVLVPMG